MTIDILLYIIIPLLPILRKVFKSTKKVLFIYYSIVILFWVIFYEKIINENFNDFFVVTASIGITFFPVIYYVSTNENRGIIEAAEFLLFYVFYTAMLILNIYALITGSSSDEIATAIKWGEFFMSLYLVCIPLFLSPFLVSNRFKNMITK